jgi:DNA-binding response OmpR family regulator
MPFNNDKLTLLEMRELEMICEKILVVDDEIKACRLLSKFLSNKGFLVETALDGSEALMKADEFRPNCILLDIRMPQGGLALLSDLKAKLPESIIIMVSAIIEENQEQDYLEKGAHSCIDKPVNLEMLLETILQAFQSRG